MRARFSRKRRGRTRTIPILPTTSICSRRASAPRRRCGEHDPEKWKPVFGQDHAQMSPCVARVLLAAPRAGALTGAKRHNLPAIRRTQYGLDAAAPDELLAEAPQADREAVDF